MELTRTTTTAGFTLATLARKKLEKLAARRKTLAFTTGSPPCCGREPAQQRRPLDAPVDLTDELKAPGHRG
ncbi:MAG TPA: hypothetical protein VKD72_01205 [Gemmataceae bacterium]|nr:hypothetical protein [Gemmataceae bacterium]